jgi:hypothetical protein
MVDVIASECAGEMTVLVGTRLLETGIVAAGVADPLVVLMYVRRFGMAALITERSLRLIAAPVLRWTAFTVLVLRTVSGDVVGAVKSARGRASTTTTTMFGPAAAMPFVIMLAKRKKTQDQSRSGARNEFFHGSSS